MRQFLALCLFLGFIASCVCAAPFALERPWPKLTGGDVVEGRPETELVVIAENRPLRGRASYLCAGIRIGPNHVLTVAHAVAGRAPNTLSVILPRDSGDRTTWMPNPVNTVHLNSLFFDRPHDFDFAILELAAVKKERALEKAHAAGGRVYWPPLSPNVEAASDAGQSDLHFHAVGWSDHGGVLEAAQLSMRALPKDALSSEELSEIRPGALEAAVVMEPLGIEDHLGVGNSGAPLLQSKADGTPYLAGIASSVYNAPDEHGRDLVFFTPSDRFSNFYAHLQQNKLERDFFVRLETAYWTDGIWQALINRSSLKSGSIHAQATGTGKASVTLSLLDADTDAVFRSTPLGAGTATLDIDLLKKLPERLKVQLQIDRGASAAISLANRPLPPPLPASFNALTPITAYGAVHGRFTEEHCYSRTHRLYAQHYLLDLPDNAPFQIAVNLNSSIVKEGFEATVAIHHYPDHRLVAALPHTEPIEIMPEDSERLVMSLELRDGSGAFSSADTHFTLQLTPGTAP